MAQGVLLCSRWSCRCPVALVLTAGPLTGKVVSVHDGVPDPPPAEACLLAILDNGSNAGFGAPVGLCTGALAAEPLSKKNIPEWVRPQLVGAASDAGKFSLDEQKLRALFPDFEWTADQLAYLDDVLRLGDSRAAVVASVDPLVVSAYRDELDAVILVRFPDPLVKQYSLAEADLLMAFAAVRIPFARRRADFFLAAGRSILLAPGRIAGGLHASAAL